MYDKLVFLKCNPKTVDFFVKALARQNDGNRFVKFLGVWAVSLNLSSNLKENIFWNCTKVLVAIINSIQESEQSLE